ncbi:MAG: surface lipoprotein assembly modifier [Neisseria sp.]|nr:surface lipoprotein assembly modifier [Neisseria sp.]
MKRPIYYTAVLLLSAALHAHADNGGITVTPDFRPEPPPHEWPVPSENAPLPVSEPSSSDVRDIDETALLADPRLLNLLLDQSVMNNDSEGIRILLPVYRRLPDAVRDNILLRLAEAKLAMSEGAFSRAADTLRGLIAEKPESDVIRLYLALALFYDRQDAAAESQFDKLMAQTALPERERKTVAAFQEQLRQRHQWRFDGGLNYTYEPNINNAPEIREEGRLKTEAEPQTASGLAYHLGAEKDWPLAGNWLAKFSADVYGKYYPNNKEYNDFIVQGSAGLGYRNAHWDISLMPFAQHRRFGEDFAPYSDSFGAKLDTARQITPQWRLANSLSGEKIRYENRKRFNGNRLNAVQTAVYQANPQQAWFASYGFERENLRDKDNSNRSHTIAAGWIQEWPHGFSTRTAAAWSKRRYRAPMPWPVLKTRRDQTLNLQVSLWHRNLHFAGITPRLTFRHTKNRSNVFFYGYKKNNLFLEMSKSF